MQKGRCCLLLLSLALITVLFWSGFGLAQNQGAAQTDRPAPAPQLCTGGPNGLCVVNPSYKQGNLKGGGGQAQQQSGPQGAQDPGRGSQPATQAPPPAAAQ